VIIDTPHVLGSAEVSALVEHVDVVLFTAWAGVSKRTELQDAARLLATPKLMGVVLMNG
jgi:Mrp family chromosome partitioning ATPase